jgi:hypothetical protein
MPAFNLQQAASLDTVSGAQAQVTLTDNLSVVVQESVLAAQPGVLTTHTDSTHGTLTMTNSGHGIITGQRIDLYWATGQTFNVTVGTVSGTSVPITLSTGTLPIATTPIVVGIATETLIAVTGNNLSAMLYVAPPGVGAYFVTDTSGADVNAQYVYGANGGSYNWYTGNGITNPLAGDTIISIWMSHNDINGADILQAGFLAH